jgi:pyruvate dehydrogenase complex dehydrogenase (E1) component
VDRRFITLGALSALARQGTLDFKIVQQAVKDLDVDPEKADPMIS